MTHRARILLLALCFGAACGDDAKIVDQGDAKKLDDSSTHWDDGPAPTPDPPLMQPGMPDAGAGVDAATDMPGADAGSDAGSPTDAGASDGSTDAA